MPIASCSVCGTPLILGKRTRWCPDGSLRTADDTTLRLVFVDTDELDHLFLSLSHQLGIPLQQYLQDGARDFSRRYTTLLLRLLNRRDLDHYPGEESIYALLCDHMRIWGMASPTVREYRDHEGISLEMMNSVNPVLPCGYFSGATEVLEGSPASCTWEEDRGKGQMDVTLLEGGEAPLEISRETVLSGPGKGNIEFSRCPECGVPQQISRISWDTDAGIITDLANGRRLAMIGADILGVAFSLMADDLGEHVLQRVIEAERDYAREVFFPVLHPSSDPLEMRSRFASLGHGDITAEVQEKTFFKIRHPFNPHFMAGRVLGFYEGWRKERVAAACKISEWGTVDLTIYN